MYDIIKVKYIEQYKLEIEFENGESGVVDLDGYLRKGGVFSRFSNLSYFKQVYVNSEIGTLCWPDGIDIAPETLYSMATNRPLPSWMEVNTEVHL